MGRRVALATIVALAAAASAAAGVADKEKIQLTAAGQAAAKAAVLTRADLGTTTGWTGGAKRPDLSSTMPCKGFDPKQSDLTLNGAAETSYKHPAGLQFDSEAQVLATPRMVALDWQRTALAPQILPCLREGIVKSLGSTGRVVSIKRIAFPKIATYATAFRTLIDVTSGATTIRVMADVVLVGRGRTEITLTTTAPYSAVGTIAPAELRLARILVARIRV
jgi:V8-like Glu-specific endopeptidase